MKQTATEDSTLSSQVQRCRKLMGVYSNQKTALRIWHDNEINEPASHYSGASILASNISYVERVLSLITAQAGPLAAAMISDVYIHGEKQAGTARRYGYSLRTLQRCFHEWMFDAVSEAENEIQHG